MEPFLTSVAVAVAAALGGKVTASAASGARTAYDKLAVLVRNRFSDEPTANQALMEVEESPDSEPAVTRLTKTVAAFCSMDPEFKQQLEAALRQADPQVYIHSGGIHNEFNGNAETSIQIGRIAGDATVHTPPTD